MDETSDRAGAGAGEQPPSEAASLSPAAEHPTVEHATAEHATAEQPTGEQHYEPAQPEPAAGDGGWAPPASAPGGWYGAAPRSAEGAGQQPGQWGQQPGQWGQQQGQWGQQQGQWGEQPPATWRYDQPTAPPPASGGGSRWVPIALLAALIGAIVGGAVGAGAARRNNGPVVRSVYQANSSRIAKPQDVQSILAKVQPGVVSIQVQGFRSNGMFGVSRVRGAGSGMILSSDGLVLTNNHVIDVATGGSGSITVTVFGSTDSRPADVVGRNKQEDLALIRIRDASGMPAVALGSSDKLRVGDDVIAIGNALALEGGPSVTSGIISAKGRSIDAGGDTDPEHLTDMLQTDAAINPGNSGGPLVNASGEVIGINTAVAGSQNGAQNIGFAIAIDHARPLIDDIRSGKAQTVTFLGVNTQTLTPDLKDQLGAKVDTGAIVQDVGAGTPAENAGLRKFDIITKIGSDTIKTSDDVLKAVRQHKPGDKVDVVVRRGDNDKTLTVTLGSRTFAGG